MWSDVAFTLLMIGWKTFGFVDVVLTMAAISLFFWPTPAAAVFVSGIFLAQLRRSINFVSFLHLFPCLIADERCKSCNYVVYSRFAIYCHKSLYLFV